MFSTSGLLHRSHSVGHLYAMSLLLRELTCLARTMKFRMSDSKISMFASILALAPSCFLLRRCQGDPAVQGREP